MRVIIFLTVSSVAQIPFLLISAAAPLPVVAQGAAAVNHGHGACAAGGVLWQWCLCIQPFPLSATSPGAFTLHSCGEAEVGKDSSLSAILMMSGVFPFPNPVFPRDKEQQESFLLFSCHGLGAFNSSL